MAEPTGNKMKFVNADDSKEELLRRAAQVAKEEELEIEWISSQDVVSSNLEKENSVFVLDPFEGSHFEYLKDQKCRIFGPRCVISCIESRTCLPNASLQPVYNLSMKGIVACCSSMAKKERQKIHTQVELMGGIIIRDFTDAVTHLIAGEVGSKKYVVACSEGKTVMTPDWVDAVWNESQNKDVKATDKQFDVNKCPIFKGCTISVTGLDVAMRQDIKQLCDSNGGTYSGELNMNTCTHLLVNVPKGNKYEFARKWSIHCVSTQWFYDCIKTGFWLDETTYHTVAEDESHLSQPSSRLHISQTANSTALSRSTADRKNTKAAQAAYKSAQTRGDGGLIADSSRTKANATLTSRNMTNNTPSTMELDLDFTVIPGCMFLDGCTVFFSGFHGDVLDKLRKAVNSGGGTRFNMINEKVSHVIVGNKVSKDLDVLQKCDFHPYVVTAQWIIDSARNGRQMPEEDYIYPDFKIDEETPSFKENEKPSDNNSTTNNQTSKSSLSLQKSSRPDHDDHLDDDEVFMQYTTQVDQPQTSETSTLQQNTCKATLQSNDDNGDDDNGGDDNGDDTTPDDNKLLTGYSFRIVHFDSEQVMQLTEIIEGLGGEVLHDKMADYAILPMNVLYDKKVAKENVTFCWLEQSIQKGELLDPDSCFLFRCFDIGEGIAPLKDCVLTISQYVSAERDHLMQLAELLGAKCQEHFVHKPSRRFSVSTHLLCEEPSGNKYSAALKWNIPVTNKDWLFACAKNGSLQPVEDFSVVDKPGKIVSQNKEGFDVNVNDEVVQPSLENLEGNKQSIATPNVQSKNQFRSDKNTPLSIKSTVPSLQMPFRPSFDVADAMEELESPLVPSLRSRKSRASRNSFPLDDFFQEHIQQAVKRTGVGVSSLVTSEQNDRIEDNENEEDKEEDGGILHGVILAVSKKLNSQQTELYGIASSLGASYRWVFDMSCTHLVHQGRTNDSTKEYTMARDNGKSIVSPHWLHACAEARARVDEKLYPHTYNPKLSLQGVTKGRRLTRSSKTELDISIQNYTKTESPADKPAEKQNSEERTASGSGSHLSEDSRESNNKETSQRNDSEGLSDPKEDLQKQIENFMSSTKGLKGRRRSRRQTSSNSTSSNSLSSFAASNEVENDRSSNIYSARLRNHYDQRESDKSTRNDHKQQDDIEPSQSDTITYDDPAGRLERERIMARIKNGCSPSPSPDDTTQDQQDDDADEDDNRVAEELANAVRGHPSLGEQVAYQEDDKDDSSQNTQTPVAPPLALQVKEVDKPTPQNLLKDLQNENPSKATVFKFHLSAMTPQEKIEYSGLIEQLGGEVFDTQYFKVDCSHVVVGKPNRNEKFLAAIAAGKWVLHKSFLEDSRQAGHFVDEESHEWGTDVPGEPPSKLAIAARRWRLKLKEKRLDNDDDSIGAFSGWNALLCVDKLRQPGFKRLLEAGGAYVVSSRPPFNSISNATHAFIDYAKLKPGTLDIEALYKAGIWLVKPDYIAEFLMQDPEPHPERYLIPDAARLYQADGNASAQKKRKGDELSADEKRLRLE